VGLEESGSEVIDAKFTCNLPGLGLDAVLSVQGGSTLALLGPSGAGKTTILRAIAGLVRPDSGRIAFGDHPVFDSEQGVDVAPERRGCAVVFQDYALFPHLSARENVAYPLRCQRRPRREAELAAREWLGRLDLPAAAWDLKPRALSGGQQQRVALARALAVGGRALLMDEPFSALDVRSREQARSVTLAVLREVRTTTLLVTHDPVEAAMFGDEIAVLEDGRVSQSGPAGDLLSAPRTPFVAQFAGVNLIHAELEPARAGESLREAAAGSQLFHVLTDEPPGPILITFSPVDVLLSHLAPETSARNVFQGTLSGITSLGDRCRALVDIGVPIAAEISPNAVSDLRLRTGAQVYVSIKATAIRTYR
jgi:molybdate transport system ATP-binding protein